MDQPPTADQVARIICEAAQATGADPAAVLIGVTGQTEVVHARAYAAFTIRELFPENGSVGIGRMVGAKTPKCYLSSLRYELEHDRVKWWSDETYCSVVRRAAHFLGIECLVILKPRAGFQGLASLRARAPAVIHS